MSARRADTLSDASPRNVFDIEKFLSTQLKPKPEETYAVYEIDVDGEDCEGDAGEEHIPPFIPGI